MANPLDLGSRVAYLPVDNEYRPWDFRPSEFEQGPGCADYEAFRVLPRQSSLGMAVDVGKTGVGEMVAWVRGTTRAAQGVYRVDNIDRQALTSSTFLPQLTVDVPAAHGSLPRLDVVVVRVIDSDHQGGSTDTARVHVISGTPTGGATLDNRTGAPGIPADCEHLADILVPAAASSIDAAAIRDRRRYPLPGVTPPVKTATHTAVPTYPSALGTKVWAVDTNYNNTQAAVLIHIPRRIQNASGVAWRYHTGSAPSGTHRFGLYDASGRKLTETNTTALATGATARQIETVSFTSTVTLEAGSYWLAFGLAISAGQIYIRGSYGESLGAGDPAAPAPNLFLSATGGTTLPALVTAMTDMYTVAAYVNRVPVPSVGIVIA